MPNRILKESICVSDSIDKLTWFEEAFFFRLIVNCDDYGRLDARPAILKSKLFPLKERLSLKDIENALGKLADAGCVKLYECDGKPYLYLPTWEVHQRIRNKKSKYPTPTEETLTADCGQLTADCGYNPIQSKSEYKSESNPNTNICVPDGTPAPQQVMSYKDVIEMFNEICVSLPKVKELSDKRKRAIKDLRGFIEDNGGFKAFFEKVEASDFLCGRADPTWNGCCFDWIMKRSNAVKILEGNYDNKNKRKSANKGSFDADEFLLAALKNSYGGDIS